MDGHSPAPKGGIAANVLNSPVWVVVGVGLFIGFLQPLGMDTLPLYITCAYWVMVCMTGYLVYHPVMTFGQRLMQDRVNSTLLSLAISSSFAGLILSALLPLISGLFFRHSLLTYTEQVIRVIPYTLVIGAAITLISVARRQLSEQRQQLIANEQNNLQPLFSLKEQALTQLMKQLPLEKRGQLICLQIDDHYLRVFTDKGEHLLLMRFKDALTLLQDYPGLQVHRSWWVAKEQVTSVLQDGRKTQLLLSNGILAPVSKTYQNQVREAGLF